MKLSKTKGVADLLANGGTEEDIVSLTAEEPEDMWHAHNLIAANDILRAPAIRKVTRTGATGSTSSDRVRTTLTIRVESTFFDPVASALHVSGPVVEENAHVSVGQYHTLDLELNRAFTLLKPGGWDSVAKQTLAEAIRPESGDDLAAVVMQEGLANICVVTQFRTVLKQRVEHNVSKKRSGSKDIDSSTKAFYDKTLATLLRAVDFEPKDANGGQRSLLLASPGFYATDFRKHIQEQGQRTSDKKLINLARNAMVVHSSSGHVHALNEVLKSPEVQARIGDTKYGSETKLLDDFYKRLRVDDGRAWYGIKPVERAVAEGAIGPGGTLLINNSLFRNKDVETRRRYVGLVDQVKEAGGDARVLSSDHESGKRLDALGGIAAILTYPIHDLDESDDEGEGGNGGAAEGGGK